MTLKDIDITITICGKDIFSLKGNTTRKLKPPVTEDLIQVPKDLIQLHRYIVMTSDIFFANTILFFLNLSRNFCCTMVIHIANRRVKTIYTPFIEVYIYYRKPGFIIITSKKGAIIFYFCRPQRPYYWKYQAHRSGHK